MTKTVYTRGELIRRVARALSGSGLTYAIGGATAMGAAGYRRSTRDVDVFVFERDLNALMHRLHTFGGLDTFAVMEPSHYAAKIPGDPDPERRVDVLVPFSEPELSAIEFPNQWRKKRPLHVFQPTLLALTKFYAYDDSKDVRHANDLQAMYKRGLFDVVAARGMIQSVDPGRVRAYDKLIRSFQAQAQAARRPARPRPTRRFPRQTGGT